MRPTRIVLLAVLSLLAACNSGGPGNFPGNYSGSWSTTITEMGSSSPSTEGRNVTVSASTGGSADLVINLQPSSPMLCALNATRQGDDATIIANQNCRLSTGGMTGLNLTVQSGTASLYPTDGGAPVTNDAGVTSRPYELIINLSGSTSTGGTFTAVYDGVTR